MKNRQINRKLSKDKLVAELKKKNIFDATYNKDGTRCFDFSLIKHSGTEMIRNIHSGLTWHKTGSGKITGHEEALEWIVELNGTGYGGNENWRLPTVIESLRLVNISEEKRDELQIITFSDAIDVFWTCDQSIIKDRFWVVLTDQRTVREYNKKDLAYVWPVSDKAQRSQENQVEIEMVSIQGGKFMMGSNSSDAYDNEKPVHRVRVSSFEIGKYPVTQDQWKEVMGDNPSHFQEGDDYPVEQVSWDDCNEFIDKLNEMTGYNYRLPTEAEWEYACRAGTKRDRYGDLDEIAWYKKNADKCTHPVGHRMPNGFGLYDMLGNVEEWCSDWYCAYRPGYKSDPSGPSSGDKRVYRGGSWRDRGKVNRATRRFCNYPGYCNNSHVGFRLARG